MRSLIRAIHENQHSKITALDLSHNKIGLKHDNIIAEVIKTQDLKITSLDMRHNAFNGDDVIAIAKALITNPLSAIVWLDLRNNDIKATGTVFLRIACLMRNIVFYRGIYCPDYDDFTPQTLFENIQFESDMRIKNEIMSCIHDMPEKLRSQCYKSENYHQILACLDDQEKLFNSPDDGYYYRHR